MVVTICTDASFSQRYQVGTYAFWITCNTGRHKISGVLKHKLTCPSQAEMKCICNSLSYMRKYPERFQIITRIVINTDSMNAIHLFTDDTAKIKKYGLNRKGDKAILEAYKNLKHKIGKPIIFNHIKAHQHTNTPANYVNQWCDDQAKAEMSKLLIKLKAKENGSKSNDPGPVR